ncbi:hypothetical protein Esti_000398 [Eimeria stiedai]
MGRLQRLPGVSCESAAPAAATVAARGARSVGLVAEYRRAAAAARPAAAETGKDSKLHGGVLKQQQQRQSGQDCKLLLFLHRKQARGSWRSIAAAAAAHAKRWLLAGLRVVCTREENLKQQEWLHTALSGLVSSNNRHSSSSCCSTWQLLWSGVATAAAAAAAAMAAAPAGGVLVGGRMDSAAAAAAAKEGSLKGWVASTLLQCSSSAASFWGVCAVGGRLQQTLGISCASLFSRPLGLLTVAVASNAAAAAAAAAGSACSRLQQLHASSSSSGWLGAAKELQQETRGKWGGLLFQHHRRTSSAAACSSSNSSSSSSIVRSRSLVGVCALEALEGLVFFYLLGGGLYRLSPSSLVYPGAFAVRGLSLSATAGYATETERRLIKRVGLVHGCHSCGVRSSSTKWIADHQPPTAQVIRYEATTWGRLKGFLRRCLGGPRCWPQRLYPHCEACSLKQAAAVRQLTAAPPSAQAAAALAAAGPAAAKSMAARTQKLAQWQLVYRWRSLRLWHFTGGLLTLFSKGLHAVTQVEGTA